MDGKHRGTGSTPAATKVQREKEKRRKRVNFAEETRKERASDARTEETTGERVWEHMIEYE